MKPFRLSGYKKPTNEDLIIILTKRIDELERIVHRVEDKTRKNFVLDTLKLNKLILSYVMRADISKAFQ